LQRANYSGVMRRAQEYLSFLGSGGCDDSDSPLLYRAWLDISFYASLEYKQAHQSHQQLRRMHKRDALAGALKRKIQLGEFCAQAQTEAFKAERRILRSGRGAIQVVTPEKAHTQQGR
jgi:hypothetical protein